MNSDKTESQQFLDVSKKGLKTGAKVGKKAGKKAGKSITDKLGKVLKRIVAWFVGLFAGFSFTQLVCFIVIIVTVICACASILSAINSGHFYQVKATMTAEGKRYLHTFEVYTDDLYDYYKKGEKKIDDSYRYGVPWDSGKVAQKNNNRDEDGDRPTYKKIMQYIKNNEYEFFLCGIWKALITDIYVNNLSQWETLDSGMGLSASVQHTYEGGNKINTSGKSNDSWYRFQMHHYWRIQESTFNDIYGFYCDDEDLINDEDHMYEQSNRPYFVKELFKMCLDAFVNADGSYVTNIDKLNSEITGTTAPVITGTDVSATTQPAEVVSKLYGDISATTYSDYLVKKTFGNLKRSMESRKISLEGFSAVDINSDNAPTMETAVRRYYYHINNIKSEADVKKYFSDNKMYNMLKEKISSAAAGLLEFETIGSGSAGNIVALAKQQKGKGGQSFCDAMNMPFTEWCAIYAGWLLREGGGIKLDEYGWSASVGVWTDNLKAKGLYHPYGSYVPKAGDIIIFNNGGLREDGSKSRDHVGIVIDVIGSTIVTSEGNTSGSSYATTIVDEHTYAPGNNFWSSTDRIVGFGEVKLASTGTGGTTGKLIGEIKTAVPKDPSYKSVSYKLTAQQRRIIEETVSGEYGNDRMGAVLIAQCCRDALVYGFVDKPENLPSKGGYDGYYAWGGREPTQTAKDAVRDVFDMGACGVQHRILVMYNPEMCTSSWHEARRYVCTYGPVRFFDFWDGEHF